MVVCLGLDNVGEGGNDGVTEGALVPAATKERGHGVTLDNEVLAGDNVHLLVAVKKKKKRAIFFFPA